MDPARVRLRVLGGSPLHGSDALGFADGDCPWNLSLGALVMGNLMGRHFWVGCGCFFLGGRGRGRGTPGHDCRGVFAGRREFQTALFLCYILYVEQWRFRCTCLQDMCGPHGTHMLPGDVQAATVMFHATCLVFKLSGMDVEDYRFSRVDYVSTVTVR